MNAIRATSQELGRQLDFYIASIAWAPRTVRRYRHEVKSTLAEVAFGRGALAIVGGTVGVMVALAYAVGTEVGMQGYAGLSQLGATNFAAFVSAYFNTREALR